MMAVHKTGRAPDDAYTSPSVTADRLWLLVGGSAATYTAIIEGAPLSMLFVLMFGLVGYAGCRAVFRGPAGAEQRSAFTQAFSAGLFAVAISRTVAKLLDDPLQNGGDANSFFEAAAYILRYSDLFEIRGLSDGWGAIWLWKQFYSSARLIVDEPTPLVGLLVNCVVVGLGGAILVDGAKAMEHVAEVRPRVAKRLYVWCFAFWLFASFHLRDAFTVFLTIAALRTWLWLYEWKSVWRVLATTAGSLVLLWTIGTIRAESASIVIVIAVVGVAGILANTRGPLGISLAILGLLGLLLAYRIVYLGVLGAADVLVFIREGYQFDVSEQSLGDRFILSQSAPVRAVIGFGYLHVFPVPMWIGMTQYSPYHWFKSAQLGHMVFLLPMAMAGAASLWRQGAGHKGYVVLLGGLYVVITTAVALSSLETRHYSQVLPSLMILGAVKSSTALKYRLGRYFISTLVATHVLWAVLKFL